jgi:hypothetical protein
MVIDGSRVLYPHARYSSTMRVHSMFEGMAELLLEIYRRRAAFHGYSWSSL